MGQNQLFQGISTQWITVWLYVIAQIESRITVNSCQLYSICPGLICRGQRQEEVKCPSIGDQTKITQWSGSRTLIFTQWETRFQNERPKLEKCGTLGHEIVEPNQNRSGTARKVIFLDSDKDLTHQRFTQSCSSRQSIPDPCSNGAFCMQLHPPGRMIKFYSKLPVIQVM